MSHKTLKITLEGIVQGVGFRPFVYKIAHKNAIKGYVLNNHQGVLILAQGEWHNLQNFLKDLQNPPKAAKIHSLLQEEVQESVFKDFIIKQSQTKSHKTAIIPADIALCEDCKKELFDPNNRRFGYAFISCTHCGGRYSLIEALPYDRKHTAMASFQMCKKCQEEYNNPNSRRFHSEINCCQDCGPSLFYTSNLKNLPSVCDSQTPILSSCLKNSIQEALNDILQGKILALKGIGGYALVCDATNKHAIKALRERKNRPKKPLALMFKDIAMVQKYAFVDTFIENLLTSPAAPIVLCEPKPKTNLPLEDIAPNLAQIGVILPYTPLHHLLFAKLEVPLIFTSANLSGEPLVKDLFEISQKLQGVCDSALFYNRDIYFSLDDSLVQIVDSKMQILRRARGFLCDVSLLNPRKSSQNFIALGAEQKSTFTLNLHNKTILSPHLGDLENLESQEHFQKNLELFCKTYSSLIDSFVLDLHPYYTQRKIVAQKNASLTEVQHHFAHLLSNIAQNQINEEVLGVIFDGTGYGLDGQIWGGEFLLWNPKKPLDFKRIATFAPFKLLGGEAAIKDLRRLALEGLMLCKGKMLDTNYPFIASLKKDYGEGILDFFLRQHQSDKNPLCHSVGRIFDMVACLCGLLEKTSYEGEAGMILQSLAQKALNTHYKAIPYSFSLKKQKGIQIIVWFQMLEEILRDLHSQIPLEQIALNFHQTLIAIIQEITKTKKIPLALSGGCFQNKILTQLAQKSLQAKIFYHEQIPCNDGGISYGQSHYMKLKNQ